MKFKILIYSLVLFIISSCNQQGKTDTSDVSDMPVIPAVYYWKTIFTLNNYEKEFLRDNQIKKIYLRFFDVDYETDGMNYRMVPVGTLQFKDTIPQNVEIIPTVFITNECMKQADTDKLASKIVWRIVRMADTNNIHSLREIQFDCDWTPSTQNKYFDFLKKAKVHLNNHSIQLSATIRLHQLTLPVPPCRKGRTHVL